MKRFLRKIVWSLMPLVLLLLAGELAVRVRWFFFHKHDWNYMFMPFRVQDTQALDHAFFKVPERGLDAAAAKASSDQAQSPAPAAAAAGAAPDAKPAPPAATSASADQMNFKWLRPCKDREVFSTHYNKAMPYTWDDNCFRGDSVTTAKPSGELRVFVVGGSTVEDAQPDVDTWTMKLKAQLADPRVKVVNAGQTAMGSNRMTAMYESKLSLFHPDIVLYYEAWNEQTQFGQLPQIDEQLGLLKVRNGLHNALHYKSALYTYLVEKYAFMTTKDVKFWKIDVGTLQKNLDRLSVVIRHSGARMVFVTQAIRFPRHWKGVDTFDPNAVDALLDRLRNDRSYAYDTEEISCLNQRLAVFRSIEALRKKDVPVINILDEIEALGQDGRKPIFVDMGHLTWQGDELVGRLVGQKLAALRIM
jgi:hypothetical protein